jgi:hypothetical protein
MGCVRNLHSNGGQRLAFNAARAKTIALFRAQTRKEIIHEDGQYHNALNPGRAPPHTVTVARADVASAHLDLGDSHLGPALRVPAVAHRCNHALASRTCQRRSACCLENMENVVGKIDDDLTVLGPSDLTLAAMRIPLALLVSEVPVFSCG